MDQEHRHDHGNDHGHSCGCGGHHGDQPASLDDWAAAPDGQMVCPCLGLTKADIVAAIEQGAFTVALVKTMTGAGRGGDCKGKHPLGISCQGDIERLVRLYGRPPHGWAVGGGCGC